MSLEKISIDAALNECNFLANRTPETTDFGGAFKMVSKFEDGTIFVGHYAGESEWELHHSEEIVYVLEGQAQIFQIRDGEEVNATLNGGEFTVVPAGVWHRFVVQEAVKLMTITPKQPSEYSIERPE